MRDINNQSIQALPLVNLTQTQCSHDTEATIFCTNQTITYIMSYTEILKSFQTISSINYTHTEVIDLYEVPAHTYTRVIKIFDIF